MGNECKSKEIEVEMEIEIAFRSVWFNLYIYKYKQCLSASDSTSIIYTSSTIS